MINPLAFLGLPIPFKDICKIYPPKVADIISNLNYPVYKKIFFSTQEDIEDEYTEQKLPFDDLPTPFEQLFKLSEMDPKIKKIILDGFEFFIKEPVTLLFDHRIIVIGDLNQVLPNIKSINDLRILKEDNFFDFQNKLRESVGEKAADPYNPDENSKVKYFKAKARLRDRVKAKSAENINLGTSLASICCMGIGISPLNIGELSQAAMSVLIRTYQEKYKYEIDIESLLHGASSKEIKPQFWIRNIEDL